MSSVEQRARELLAESLRKHGRPRAADAVLREERDDFEESLDAIAAALREQPEARGVVDAPIEGPRLPSGGSIESKAKAWDEVVNVMDEVCPDWVRRSKVGAWAVCAAIREMAAAQQPVQEGGGECTKCRGTGEVCTGYIDGTPEMFDCTCPAAAPPSAPVGVEGEGEFWTWLRQAYNFTGAGNFTAYNMEVAYQAGRDSAITQQPAQAAPGDVASRQAWFEAEIASAESHWIDTLQEQFEDGDEVPDMAQFVALWLAERTPPGDDAAGGTK